MKTETILSVLKIAGLVVASVLGIYALTHDTYFTDSQGQRHPTTALTVSIWPDPGSETQRKCSFVVFCYVTASSCWQTELRP